MLTHEQIVSQIEEVIESLRPQLWMHGGNIEFVDFSEGTAFVQFSGACDGCPSSNYTLTLLVENTLKEEVPQVKKVVSLNS